MTNDIKDVEIRVATVEDIMLFYPGGAPRTTYSWIALYKGKPACLAGLIIERGGCIAYSEMKPGDYPKKTIWRSARALLEHIKALDLPMFAMCDHGNEKAQAFISRLGFTKVRPYSGVELYKW